PASRVRAIAADDVVRINDVLLRLRHLLDGAGFYRFASGVEGCTALPVNFGDRDFRRRYPALRSLIRLVNHHALGEQALEWLLHDIDMAGRLHRAGEEARVEKVQDRMLDAANILVNAQPAVLAIDIVERRRLRLVPWIGE